MPGKAPAAMKISELKDELLDYWVAKASDMAEVHVVDSTALSMAADGNRRSIGLRADRSLNGRE